MRGIWQVLGSVGVLAALFWWIRPEDMLGRLAQTDPAWLGLGLIALILSTLSMARRWQMTAAKLGLVLSFPVALREYYLSQFINSVLPGGVLGDVGRALRLRHGGQLRLAAQSVMAERLMGQVAIFTVTGLGLTGAWLLPGGLDWPAGFVLAVPAVLLLGAGGAALMARLRATRSFLRLLGRLVRDAGIVGHAFAATACLIFSLYACARATGTVIAPEGWVTILPLILCAMLVPLSVAGLGWREAAAVALMPMLGATPEAGLALGLCYGALMLVASLPALPLFVLLGRRGHHARPEVARERP